MKGFVSRISTLMGSIHMPLFISGSLVIILGGLLATYVVLYPHSMVGGFFSNLIPQLGSVGIVSSGSRAEISLVQDRLILRFDLAVDDVALAKRLSEKLGVTTDWQEGVEVSIDANTAEMLRPFLPAESTILFDDTKVQFLGGTVSFLQSALPKETASFATGSGSVKVYRDEHQISVLLQQPSDLVVYATESGVMNISGKIDSELFSLSDKVATIDLRLEKKSLRGEIVLK